MRWSRVMQYMKVEIILKMLWICHKLAFDFSLILLISLMNMEHFLSSYLLVINESKLKEMPIFFILHWVVYFFGKPSRNFQPDFSFDASVYFSFFSTSSISLMNCDKQQGAFYKEHPHHFLLKIFFLATKSCTCTLWPERFLGT